MKYLFITFIFFSLLYLACSTEPNRESYMYIVYVDSIAHPQSVALNDSITIQLYGTIGTDGCSSFSYFDAAVLPLQLDLKVIAERSASDICPAVMVYLDGKEYKCKATQSGWFKIYIHQPDKTVLQDSVLVQ